MHAPEPIRPFPSLLLTATLPPSKQPPSIPFVLSEGALLLLGSAAFYLQLAFYQRRPRARLRDLGVNPDRWPTVDVMVPCFKEPIAVSARWGVGGLCIHVTFGRRRLKC